MAMVMCRHQELREVEAFKIQITEVLKVSLTGPSQARGFIDAQ